jgi:cytidylate kinase
MPKKRIIAIDGPVGSGKTTVARRVADLLGYMHIDSGAMYRALGLKALRTRVSLEDPDRLEQLADETHIEMHRNSGRLQVLLDAEDITDHIRTPEVSQAASKVALVSEVRRILVAEQRRAGHHGGVVMEGRDIGTVVFPDADLKIYLDATAEVRAERRLKEHVARGDNMDFHQVVAEIKERDLRDMQRTIAPLTRAADAVVIDSTAMSIEEVARLVCKLMREQESAAARP